MLSREHRVPRRHFSDILAVSRSWHLPMLSLRTARRRGDGKKGAPQFAFVVSHKVAARAVDRNRLKRRARAIAQELLPMVKDNQACLLFFKKGAPDLSYQELKNIIQSILARASVI